MTVVHLVEVAMQGKDDKGKKDEKNGQRASVRLKLDLPPNLIQEEDFLESPTSPRSPEGTSTSSSSSNRRFTKKRSPTNPNKNTIQAREGSKSKTTPRKDGGSVIETEREKPSDSSSKKSPHSPKHNQGILHFFLPSGTLSPRSLTANTTNSQPNLFGSRSAELMTSSSTASLPASPRSVGGEKNSEDTKPSLLLTQLITEQRYPELWRKTVIHKSMDVDNEKKIALFKEFPWFTRAALTSINGMSKLSEVKKEQKALVEHLEVICAMLDHGFQIYLKKFEDDFAIAQQFCQKIREQIENTMSPLLLSDHEPLLDSLNSNEKKRFLDPDLCFSREYINQMVHADYQAKAQLMIHNWKFHQAFTISGPLAPIYHALKKELDMEQYTRQLEILEQKIIRLFVLRREQKEQTELYERNISHGIDSGTYTELSKLLGANKPFNDMILKKISQHFMELTNEYSINNWPRNFPSCAQSEGEFFFLRRSQLLDDVNLAISQHLGDKSSLKKAHTALSPRQVKCAEYLADDIIALMQASIHPEETIHHLSSPK